MAAEQISSPQSGNKRESGNEIIYDLNIISHKGFLLINIKKISGVVKVTLIWCPRRPY